MHIGGRNAPVPQAVHKLPHAGTRRFPGLKSQAKLSAPPTELADPSPEGALYLAYFSSCSASGITRYNPPRYGGNRDGEGEKLGEAIFAFRLTSYT